MERREDFDLPQAPVVDEKDQDILSLDAEIHTCLEKFRRMHGNGATCLAGAVLETAERMLTVLERREQIDARMSDTENVFRLEHIIRELKNVPKDSHVGKSTLETLEGLLRKNAPKVV